jgi:hypothetical protein
MDIEYRRALAVQKICELLTVFGPFHVRMCNVVEKILLDCANTEIDGDRSNRWFSFDLFDQNAAELWFRFSHNQLDLDGYKSQIKAIFDEHETCEVKPLTYSIKRVRGDDYLITFKSELAEHNAVRKLKGYRYAYLRSKSSHEDIAKCVLRYMSINASGNQWGIPVELTKIIPLPFTLECFASPFNTRFAHEGIPFCSLFKDVDGVFGSIGSFFESDLEGQVVMCNPPYTIDLMNRSIQHLLCEFDRCEKLTAMVMVSYSWDAEYHLSLEKSEYLKELVILPKKKHWYTAPYLDKEKPSFIVTSFFVLCKGEDYKYRVEPTILSYFDCENIKDDQTQLRAK